MNSSGLSGDDLPAKRKRAKRIIKILQAHMPHWKAPVVSLMASQRQDPFLVLIGCLLSLRTKDEVTASAAERLFRRAHTPEAMLQLDESEIERLIYPVGFYRTKARTIRRVCRDLIERFKGKVPDTLEELLSLQGVGRKTANLVLAESFGKPAICVDTHVHRISNRLGLVNTTTPTETEEALRKVLSRRDWGSYNKMFVAFGQTICKPVSPWCSRCPVEELCPRVGVETHR